MLHPSYGELISIVNDVNKEKSLEEINSRYSIVIAAARRARDIVDGDPLMVEDTDPERSVLSKAVDEMQAGKVGIGFTEAEEEKMLQIENLAVVDFSRDMEEEE